MSQDHRATFPTRRNVSSVDLASEFLDDWVFKPLSFRRPSALRDVQNEAMKPDPPAVVINSGLLDEVAQRPNAPRLPFK